MSDQRWRRIEEICHDALARPTDDRAAFVREAGAPAMPRCAWKWNRSSRTRAALRQWDRD